jgi:hypothetical protein
VNDKFYIGDVSNGQKQKVKLADNILSSKFRNWILYIKNNLEFNYTEGDNTYKKGNISYAPTKWMDFIQSDSTYQCSVILNENIIKIPLGFTELETIRGPFYFMIYYYLGRREYEFNGKKMHAFNSIVLESNNVEIVLTEVN